LERSYRLLFAPVLLALPMSIFLLTACSPSNQLPHEARQVLEEQIAALPGSISGFQIGRAWKGAAPTGESTPWPSSMQVWCVEVETEFDPETEVESQPVIWIVTRTDESSEWTAAMLMTMSSLWPYQACGVFD